MQHKVIFHVVEINLNVSIITMLVQHFHIITKMTDGLQISIQYQMWINDLSR